MNEYYTFETPYAFESVEVINMHENAPLYDKISVNEFIAYSEHPLNRNKDFELINGNITMMSSPLLNHERIVRYISSSIYSKLKNKKCEVLETFNVFLDEDNVFRPDIMIVCDKSKLSANGYNGAPDFIIEVLSKSTKIIDKGIKLDLYMKYGVKEYWIVDPFVYQVLIYKPNSNILQHCTFNEVIKPQYFDIEIDFSEILEIIK